MHREGRLRNGRGIEGTMIIDAMLKAEVMNKQKFYCDQAKASR